MPHSTKGVRLEVGRTLIDGFVSLRISWALREFASAFSVELLDHPKNAWVKPFSQQRVRIFIDEELVLTGRIEKISKGHGHIMQLEGRSLVAILVDASVVAPLQYHQVTLFSLAQELAQPFNINVVTNIKDFPTHQQVTAEVDSTIFQLLNKIAEKENIFLSSTPEGDILLSRYEEATIQYFLSDSVSGYISSSVVFDSTVRFSSLTLLAQTSSNLDLNYRIEDKVISNHPLVEVVEAEDLATLELIAQRRLATSIMQAAQLNITLHDWLRSLHAPRLIGIGDRVQVEAASLGLKESTWMIESVTMQLSSNECSTNLKLMLPYLSQQTPLEANQPW